jgi:hypothetical protein
MDSEPNQAPILEDSSEAPRPKRSVTLSGQVLTALGVLLVSSLLVRVQFYLEPPGRDQSLFLAEATRLLQGRHLYLEVWEHKPPGVVFAYTVALALLGRAYDSIQILDWLCAWMTGFGIWALARRFTRSHGCALAAGLLYTLMQAGVAFGGFWAVAQAEVLMDPLLIASLLLLTLRSRDGRGAAIRAALAGACLASVVLLKYSAAVALPLGAWLAASSTRPRAPATRAVAAYLVGVLVPIVAVGTYLLATGAGHAFWQATVTFNMEHQSVSALSRTEHLFRNILFDWAFLAPLYFFTLLAWPAWMWARFGPPPKPSGSRDSSAGAVRLLTLGCVLWGVSLAEVFWQSKFWIYHYHVLLLPLCLTTSAGLALLGTALARWIQPRLIAAAGAAALGLLLLPAIRDTRGYTQYHGVWDFWTGRIDKMQFWSTYRWGGTDYDYAENAIVSLRIEEQTSPSDAIFVWGFEPGIYFLSGRRPSSRFLYDYPLMPRFQSVHDENVAALMGDLERDPPRLFLVLRRDANAIEADESWEQLTQLQPLARFVRERYEPAWELGDYLCLRARDAADRAQQRPRTTP